jgi:hypothetical protein
MEGRKARDFLGESGYFAQDPRPSLTPPLRGIRAQRKET